MPIASAIALPWQPDITDIPAALVPVDGTARYQHGERSRTTVGHGEGKR
jgi:hypothetical protein